MKDQERISLYKMNIDNMSRKQEMGIKGNINRRLLVDSILNSLK